MLHNATQEGHLVGTASASQHPPAMRRGRTRNRAVRSAWWPLAVRESDFCSPRNALNWNFTVVTMAFTIFEGNSEIQRLIIARAIFGVHVK